MPLDTILLATLVVPPLETLMTEKIKSFTINRKERNQHLDNEKNRKWKEDLLR